MSRISQASESESSDKCPLAASVETSPATSSRAPTLCEFHPHPLLWNAHLQTITGIVFHGRRPKTPVQTHCIELSDGDRIALQGFRPAVWCDGDPA